MDYFSYRKGQLCCEDVPVADIVRDVGTPVYIYSLRTVSHHVEVVRRAFSKVNPLICYSLKANSNRAILKLLVSLDAGFDVVSGGELFRALSAGACPERIVFAGIGKAEEEIAYALKSGILLLNAESEPELEVINNVAARLGKVAPVALRVNPDVDPVTHTYITTGKKENKFGIDLETAWGIIKGRERFPHVNIRGVHFHIGSQITEVKPFVLALEKTVDFVLRSRSAGVDMRYLDAGGGFGIYYRAKEAKAPEEFARAMIPLVEKSGCTLLLEPGRLIVGNAGILVTKVLYVKQAGKNFAICDSGMSHLIRPALYGAYHRIWPVETDIPEQRADEPERSLPLYDVVGPICESADFFAKDRPLPPLKRGMLLAVFSAGAYGMTMSSQYNSRPRPAEVVVEDASFRLARRKEEYEDLVRDEL